MGIGYWFARVFFQDRGLVLLNLFIIDAVFTIGGDASFALNLRDRFQLLVRQREAEYNQINSRK